MRLGTWLSPTASILALLLSAPACESGKADEAEAGDDGTDEDAPWEPTPARGDIHLSSVVVNQGVDVTIANAGEWVGPAERNTYVVANRDTLLRGFWEIPQDWIPRPITAQLELRYPDGTTETFTDTKVIDGPSFPGDINRAFFFPLVAEQFPYGVQYHMTLWEAEEGHEDERESTTVIESPIGGLAEIGIQSEPAELRAVLVPVRYTTPNCNTNTAELTEEQERLFLDYLHEQNPVQEVIWEFRRDSPIQWSSELKSLSELWQPLQEMRVADAAPPNAYYYALVDACASGIDGAGGIAPGLPPATKEAAYQRVSSGLWLDGNNYSYHTFVHELGHNQGLAHVFCPNGGAAGTDPGYPHDTGITGVWGFGIRLFRFHSPTGSYDYMTYCGPNWVSDWTWSKTFKRIRTLTSWEHEGSAEPEPQGEVLIGLLLNDGSEKWWTTRGGREAEYWSGAQTIAFEYQGEIIQQPAAIELLDDGTRMITAPVPRPRVAIEGAVRYANGQAHPIDLQPDAAKSWSF